MGHKAIRRAGVLFNCPECGKLWKDDGQHGETQVGACSRCSGDLRLVGMSADAMLVGDAVWYRCMGCGQLFMKRRGEIVTAENRAGFEDFT